MDVKLINVLKCYHCNTNRGQVSLIIYGVLEILASIPRRYQPVLDFSSDFAIEGEGWSVPVQRLPDELLAV